MKTFIPEKGEGEGEGEGKGKGKGKVRLSLCFNWAPRHEGVLGEWRYSSIHSL